MRVAFLGRGRLGMRVLDGLLRLEGIDVPLVGTCRHSREVGLGPESFEAVAGTQGIPFRHIRGAGTDLTEALRDAKADLAVAMLWVTTIRADAIATVPHGVLNVHGGMLPRYRGNASQTWAILNREREIGVTCHLMEPDRLDSGPVIAQSSLPLTETSTIGDVFDAVEAVAADLVIEAVKQFHDGSVIPRPQNESEASFGYPRLPRDGQIDWKTPARDIDALIRGAGEPYPGAYSWFSDALDNGAVKKLTIWRAHVEPAPFPEIYAVPGHLLRLGDGKWAVACGDLEVLVLDDVSVDETRGEPGSFFRSVRQRLGLAVDDSLAELLARVDALERRLGES